MHLMSEDSKEDCGFVQHGQRLARAAVKQHQQCSPGANGPPAAAAARQGRG